MSIPSPRPFAAFAAAILSLGLLGPAMAHAEEAPTPAVDAATERQAERQALREERKAQRAEARDERKAAHDQRTVERALARDERKAARTELRAAWTEAQDECKAELQAVREDAELDRVARREALADVRGACRVRLATARDEFRAAATDRDGAPAIDDIYSAAAPDGTGVVRTDLGIAEPGSAPGEELGLWHYFIPAQTDLVAHTHPGWQLARVTDGELEYTVLEGEGVLLRGEASEPMGPGTYVLAAGDGVIENPELIHQASNRTDEPVTIISATLFPSGAELSTLIEGVPGEAAADDDSATDKSEEASAVEAEPAEG